MPEIDRRHLLKAASATSVAGLTGLAGCLGGGGGDADSLSIGVVTDTSGPYAHLGNSVIRGIKLGLAQSLDADTEELADSNTVEGSGVTVEILTEASGLAADTGRQKARKLVQSDEVDILQGSVSSSVAAR